MKSNVQVVGDVVSVEMTVENAERMGHHVYDYTLKYVINGSKFKRNFDRRDVAIQYAMTLTENGIESKLSAKPHKDGPRLNYSMVQVDDKAGD